jgi:hypothetical protein
VDGGTANTFLRVNQDQSFTWLKIPPKLKASKFTEPAIAPLYILEEYLPSPPTDNLDGLRHYLTPSLFISFAWILVYCLVITPAFIVIKEMDLRYYLSILHTTQNQTRPLKKVH